mgnify:CR=1 FL=1
MGVVSNLNQALAWGTTPFWVSNQLNGTFKSGTGTGSYKDGWGSSHTYTYTIYGLSNISTGGGNTFNLSNWNSWNNSQQGSQANLTYLNGGYGLAMNTGGAIISQNVGDVTYGTPVLTSSQAVAQNAQGSALISTIDNTQGSAAITQTISFEASQSAESNASTTQGYSNTTELSVGAEVSAEFAGIGASVNTSVTNSTTIDSSTTSGTSNSTTLTTGLTNTYTVEPGYKIQVQMMYTNQQINMPYTAPISISGTIVQQDQWGNTLTNTAGNIISWSNYYGLTPNGVVSSANAGSLLATGIITNLNALNFTTTQTTLVKPATAASLRVGLQPPKNAPLADQFLPHVTKDGEVVEVGALYDSKRKNAIIKGSSYGDLIYMKGDGQIAYTHSGSDFVSGSKYSDRIFVGAYNTGTSVDSDVIESNDGNDRIRVISGAHIINSGNGDDDVYITLSGGKASRVTLGNGKDLLTIDLKDSLDEGSDFIVTDFSSEDKVKYVGLPTNALLTAETLGDSTEIFVNGSHVGTFIDQSSTSDRLTGQNLVEVGLLNIDSILLAEGASRSPHIDDWRGQLNKFAALGGNIIDSYDSLINNSSHFKRVLNSLQKYVFEGDKESALTKWADSKAEKFDTIQSLASAVLNRADIYGLTNPVIPTTYFEFDQPVFTAVN